MGFFSCEKEFGPKPLDTGFYQKVYGNGQSGELLSGLNMRQFPKGRSIEMLDEGGMIGMGSLYFEEEDESYSSIYLFKTDQYGFIDEEVLLPVDENTVSHAVDLHMSPDGFIVAGSVTRGEADSVINEIYLARLNRDLIVEWETFNTIPGVIGFRQPGEPHALVINSQNEIVVLGAYQVQNSGTVEETAMFLGYFDMEGNLLSDRVRTYPDGTNDELGRNILDVAERNRLVWTGSYTQQDIPQASFIEAPYNGDIPVPVPVEDIDNRVGVSSIYKISLGFMIVGTEYKPGGDRDLRVIKVDRNGNISPGGIFWARSYEAGGFEEGISACEAFDGGYMILGAASVSGNKDFYLIKIDASGEIQWERKYGGPGEEIPSEIISTSKGYAMIGTSLIAGSKLITVINMDRQGNIVQD